MAKHLAAGLVLGWALTASSAMAATGEYWEVTNKMEMAGMTLPGMTAKVCIPKGGEKDPRNVNGEKDCEISDVKFSGNKSSWKMRCTKDGDVMTGSGDLTSTPDRTEGVIKMNSKQGDMTMSFVNKRVGGACDPDEMKKKVDAMVDANADRLLWGSDWPFVRMGEHAPTTAALLGLFSEWVDDEALRSRILVDNPSVRYR